MIKKSALLLAFVLCLTGCVSVPMGGMPHGALAVARDGEAFSRIVVAADAPPSTHYAAEELQRFLGEITGAKFEIVQDTTPAAHAEISLGRTNRLRLGSGIDESVLKNLGQEGYVLKTAKGRLFIAGGEPRGTLYGVYGLLEDHLGCRWFTPTISRIPKMPVLTLSALDERVVPALEYREPFVMDCFDGDWAARNRMNSSAARLEERHGGKVMYFGFVHTFEGLLPPSQYYDAHPEYYSLVKGKRLKEKSQLCCTNEDVMRLVTEEVLKRMREHPEATVFSVSQNDWLNYCECDRCTALAEAEGSQMAPLLLLVNHVAKAAAKEFPDKVIDTLAYQYTRKPPKTMRPEPNVIIRLCSIECCFSHPFEKCNSAENRSFVADVEGWAKQCNRLWVWNYDTSFSHYFAPFPNLAVRGDNIRFYVRNHVTGIFEQDVYTTLNGELSGLSGYLGAKLLWNPAYDENLAIAEYLDAVYGKAAGPIREYIDLIHNKVQQDNLHMDIWISPEHPLLNDGVLEKSIALWDKAEVAVANEPEVLERVKVARLSIDYAQIERMRGEGLQVYTIDHANRALAVRPEFMACVNRFFDVALRNGVTQIRESKGDIMDYKKELEAYQTVVAGDPHKAKHPKGLKPGIGFAAYEGVWNELPDFKELKPVEKGVAEKISLDCTQRREAVALDFNGYFLAPADGVYVFHCRSNDGSKLYVDGETVVNNDGLHKVMTGTGIVSLKKGHHALRVSYFESGGAEALSVYYEGPEIDKREIPLEALWHK